MSDAASDCPCPETQPARATGRRDRKRREKQALRRKTLLELIVSATAMIRSQQSST